MTKIILVLLCVFLLNFLFSQSCIKHTNETTTTFLENNKPTDNAKILGKIIETKEWNDSINLLFVFYSVSRMERAEDRQWKITEIKGYVFIPENDSVFKRIYIDTYAQQGSFAIIDTLFFANADKDASKELVILCKWDSKDTEGNPSKIYSASFYDNIQNNNQTEELTILSDFETVFGNQFEGINKKGKLITAKYKSIVQINKKLKKII